MSTPRLAHAALIGLLTAVALFAASLVVTRLVPVDFFNLLFFGERSFPADFPPGARRYILFLCGVLGAVMVGWMAGLLALAVGPLRTDPRAWRSLGLSLIVWFVLDTTFSLVSGIMANALLNTVIFVPLLGAWWLVGAGREGPDRATRVAASSAGATR